MRIISIALLILFSSLAIAAAEWHKATRGDWRESPYAASLPPFCGTSKDPRWVNVSWAELKERFGHEITHSNHLCSALTKIPICRKFIGKDRIACLSSMSEGYTYWLKHIRDPNYKLLPYIYVAYGDHLNEIGDTGKAIAQYQAALNKDPKYIKAYKGLIDTYIKLGMLKQAEESVNAALKIKETKSLLLTERENRKIN